MADDNTAEIKLKADIADALASFKKLEAEYKTALQNLARATKAGLDPASAEFVKLQAHVTDTRAALLATGERGQASMLALAAVTGNPTKGLAALEGKIIATRAELVAFGSQGGAAVEGIAAGVGGLTSAFKALGPLVAALGLAKVVSEATDVIVASVEAAGQAELAQTKLEAILRATGNAAGITAERLIDLSKQEERLVGVSDEEVQAVERVLLGFTELKSNVLPAVIKLTFDLAQQMGGDATAAATLLGKALSEPERATETLRRSGVALGKALDAEVTQLVKTGHTMEAQQVVIKALQDRIGGLAEAAGDTMPGALNKLREALDDAGEALGEAFAPQVKEAANEIASFITANEANLREIGAGAAAITGKLVTDLGRLIGIYDSLGLRLEDIPKLLNPLTAGFVAQRIVLEKVVEAVGLSDTSTVKLGASSRSLSESLKLLAAHEHEVEQATQRAAAASEHAAVAREAEASKALIDAFNAQRDAVHKTRDEIEGNTAALAKNAEAIGGVLPHLAEHGRLTRETFENAKGVIQDALDQYAKFGVEVPDWLAKVSQQFGILTSAQAKFRDQISGAGLGLDKQAADLRVAYEAAVSYGEINRHTFENAKEVVEKALDQYEHFGQQVPADLAAVATALGALTTAQQKLKDSIVGNSAELIDQTKNLEAVIASVEKEGKVTPAIQDNIRDKLAALTKQYEEFGQKVPASLQHLVEKYKEVEAAQLSLADVFAGGDADKKQKDLKDESAALKDTVKALEEKQQATGLSIEEEQKLFDAKDRLLDVTRELTTVTNDLAAEQTAAANAASGLRDDVANAVDGMGRYAKTTQSTADALGDVSDKKGPVAEAFKEIGDAIKKALGDEVIDATTKLEEYHVVLEKVGGTWQVIQKVVNDVAQTTAAL